MGRGRLAGLCGGGGGSAVLARKPPGRSAWAGMPFSSPPLKTDGGATACKGGASTCNGGAPAFPTASASGRARLCSPPAQRLHSVFHPSAGGRIWEGRARKLPFLSPAIRSRLLPRSCTGEKTWGMGAGNQYCSKGGGGGKAPLLAAHHLLPQLPIPASRVGHGNRTPPGGGNSESRPAGRSVGTCSPSPIARSPLPPVPTPEIGLGARTRAGDPHCRKGGEPGKLPGGGSGGGLAPACLIPLTPLSQRQG